MKYDVIVVGSGAAGGIVASRVAEDPNISVLLLEEGPDFGGLERYPEDATTSCLNLRGVVTPFMEGYPAIYTKEQRGERRTYRGKILGGGSAINGGVFIRGHRDDFDRWAAEGNDEWSYVKVLPYWRRMETDLEFGGEYHGKEGPIFIRRAKLGQMLPMEKAFYEACRVRGFADCPDMNAPDASGVGPHPVNSRGEMRISTAIGYLEPARHRVNLTIRGGTRVTKVVVKGGRAVGVRAVSGGEEFEVEGRQVVLSAGAIESPRLLMLSGIGPSEELRRLGVKAVVESPGVGQNLYNHATAYLSFHNDDRLPTYNITNEVFLRYTASGSEAPNDMAMTLESKPATIDGRSYYRVAVTLEYPHSVGRMTLTSSEAEAAPRLDYGMLSDKRDMKRLAEGVRLAVELSKHKAFKGIMGSRLAPGDGDLASEAALEGWLRREIVSYYHSSGTCRMGSDEMSVVDQRCRVRGVEGLWVIDSSVMPHIARGNINATCCLIGERGADFVREALR
ncbi:MAG: mycofactocin system GMC family oxidoreductase MftG [SAR202 cluster bacterium]|nr:mycofactocin system GMC family oxidoreductase MftG [SAR202 cluster bacterium]